jgi:hypothetical protein
VSGAPLKSLYVALVCSILLSFAGPARGSEADRAWKTIRVGVLPGDSFVRVGAQMFEEDARTRGSREEIGVWQRRVEEALRKLDLVRLLEPDELRERLESRAPLRQTLALARERFELGKERYRALELEPAGKQLDRALALMVQSWSEVTQPRLVADTHLYRGLAMMDRGLESEALMAFRSMWLHDPSRRFQSGYYPAVTESVMKRALDDLVAMGDLVGARYPAARLSELTRETQVDSLVSVTLRPGGTDSVLRVVIYDAASRLRTVDLSVSLDDRKRASELLDRALSRWHSCAVRSEERTYVAKPRLRRWQIEFGYGHTLFLKDDRTRAGFASPGANIALSYRIGRVLQLFAQTHQMVSVPDVNRDLMEPMMTSRLAFGAGLSAEVGRFEPYARAGVEMGLTLSEVKMTRDVSCKHFVDAPTSLDPALNPCDPSRVFTVEAPAFVAGLHAGLGLRWRVVQSWHAQLEVQLSGYVFGSDFPISDLNFPLTLGAGLGHRF